MQATPAQRVAVGWRRPAVADAWALLCELENNIGSSKAAATAGLSVAKTATSCAGVACICVISGFFSWVWSFGNTE